jgi:hypothetical protein
MERIFAKLNQFFRKKWHLAVLDMDIGRWMLEPKTSNIPYLKAENANGRHILLQPHADNAPNYFLIDDLNLRTVNQQHKSTSGKWKPGRLIIETSPGNYQVWIHSSRPLSLEEKRYWLKRLNSDPGADPNNRWGRCPGFRNRKIKYRDPIGGYPLARLHWVDWIHQANVPPAPDIIKQSECLSPQPLERGVCHLPIYRSSYERGNESATDFAYALALFRRGHNPQFVRQCLMKEREDWKNHGGRIRIEKYLDRTIDKASKIVQSA